MSRVAVSKEAFIEETIISRFQNGRLVDSVHGTKYMRLVGKRTVDIGIIGRNDALGYIPYLWDYVQGNITFDSFIIRTCLRDPNLVREDEQLAFVLETLDKSDSCDAIFIRAENKVTCMIVQFNPETQGAVCVDLCPLPAESCIFGVGSLNFASKFHNLGDLNYVSPIFNEKIAGDFTGLVVEVACQKSNVPFSQCLCVSVSQPLELMMI